VDSGIGDIGHDDYYVKYSWNPPLGVVVKVVKAVLSDITARRMGRWRPSCQRPAGHKGEEVEAWGGMDGRT
jgi:hypothetical protein